MWRCVHFRREVRPDAVRFYAPWAFAGTHTLSYDAIAATRGEFGLPPALAAAALEPETMGLSAGGGISVQDVSGGSHHLAAGASGGASLARPAAPLRCAADCSGRGACVSGECRCAAGWGGANCSLTARPPPAFERLDDAPIILRSGESSNLELNLDADPDHADGMDADTWTDGTDGVRFYVAVEAGLPGADLRADLDRVGGRVGALKLRLNAPIVHARECVALFLVAAVDDGATLSSARVAVHVLPPTDEHPHGGEPLGDSCKTWGKIPMLAPPSPPGGEDDEDVRIEAKLTLVGAAALALLCCAVCCVRATNVLTRRLAGGIAGNEMRQLHDETDHLGHVKRKSRRSWSPEVRTPATPPPRAPPALCDRDDTC